jgi:hypothetical protein
MKIKGLCFKHGKVWFIFCGQCGKMGSYDTLGFIGANGARSLQALFSHMENNCTKHKHVGYSNYYKTMVMLRDSGRNITDD